MSWRPSAPVANLIRRSEILHQIREFFHERGVLEVQTPSIAENTVSDPFIKSIRVPDFGYLQTSPEFYMKRLLAEGMPSCYQICSAFRSDQKGKWHNHEFTILEWYRIGFGLEQLIAEVNELINAILGENELIRLTVRDLFQQTFDIDIFEESDHRCIQTAKDLGCMHCDDARVAYDFLIDRAMSQQPHKKLVIHGFPPHSAALSKITQVDGHPVAQRFEFLVGGLEVANGYDELRDSDELARRIDEDNEIRRQNGDPMIEPDAALLNAMRHGLPKCAGVAVGLDRLIALKFDEPSIDRVQSFH